MKQQQQNNKQDLLHCTHTSLVQSVIVSETEDEALAHTLQPGT